ncbi:MAG: HdeD family acid-resistance protein [Fibrobacter sp.]|nr:HdeD family acid-resistance protein [Fibrobacter sp.]
MAMSTIDIDRKTYENMRNWGLALGIGMIILGLLTISFSVFTTFFGIILLGIVLAVRGVVDIVTAFTRYRHNGMWWHLFGGIFALALGLLVIARPGITAASLTLLIAAFLVVVGLFKTIAAPVEHESNWGWVMLSGIISLAFGIWILSIWPAVSFFLIGLFIGIEILIQGVVMAALPFTTPHPGKGAGEAYAH